MRWQNRDESGNVEDRRGQPSSIRGIPVRGKAGVLLLIVVMVAGYYGIDLTPLLTGGANSGTTASRPHAPSAKEREMARFSSVVLKTTEDAWHTIFRKMGKAYKPPKLVLYSGSTDTACGYGRSAMGPFYCPGDQTVYLDLSFFKDMETRLGGGGDFAQGYVIAHEVGHHVQDLLGTTSRVRSQTARVSQAEANRLSVMVELQADCYAGVWGHSVNLMDIMDSGDLQEALDTARAIGDDRLQRQSGGRVVPDSFTHGTSEQRYTWFKRGYDSGNPNVCNTFDGV